MHFPLGQKVAGPGRKVLAQGKENGFSHITAELQSLCALPDPFSVSPLPLTVVVPGREMFGEVLPRILQAVLCLRRKHVPEASSQRGSLLLHGWNKRENLSFDITA